MTEPSPGPNQALDCAFVYLLYLLILTTNSQLQTTLEGSISRQPRVPPFSTHGLIDYIVQLVVSEDNAFQLLDRQSFRQLLHYLRPMLHSKDIPHRTKIREVILERAKQAEGRVKFVLQVCSDTCYNTKY
jgi:hypothetical protein